MEYPEGATPLDADELEGLKFPHVTTRGELDHLEQANIEAGLLWLNHLFLWGMKDRYKRSPVSSNAS